ncbi:conserved unknown protein [Ectocarpus siliculosus]|uniref:Uncharacterized protein n=1 Tax=Ectocarpus siliculosus TaxID=2880 RepID=D8LSW8_ECTSI|nr:conserved unknown protein [Ectocarpus siliculosus]|eukprot:CBN77895.1 conserved unknown protein [Ectocarpus siliculosus]
MEVDLASFLAPAGDLLGEVSQRVLEFLSVRDLIEYVASSSPTSPECGGDRDADTAERVTKDEADYPENPRRRRQHSVSGRDFERQPLRGGSSGPATMGRNLSPEEEVPHRLHSNNGSMHFISTTGAGDEAGGGSRPPSPYLSAKTDPRRRDNKQQEWEGDVDTECSNYDNSSSRFVGDCSTATPAGGLASTLGGECSPRTGGSSGCGVHVVVVGGRRRDAKGGLLGPASRSSSSSSSSPQKESRRRSPSIFGVLVGLGLHPWATLQGGVAALQGGVAHLLGGVPLLALLRWAAGGASAVLGVSFRVALLPYDVTKGAVAYVVGSLEAMLNIATEIWSELRHLSLAELAVVISCVVTGNPLPDFLLDPDYDSVDSGGSSYGGGGGRLGNSRRIFSRSSRGSPGLESGGGGGFLSDYLRGPSSAGYPDDEFYRSGGAGGTRVAWQQAHAMRRRLDRVNRTASLVSYEERAESAVPRAKAQRVRRRMHYAMSLQCFQATVTKDGQHSAGAGSDAIGEDGDDDDDGRVSVEGGSSAFMCTPQSFPPTPVSRAHVMARTSQFSDDVLFLARDHLRLGENLKPGVDETTRATADFLRRQQRLAVLDGHDACEGIVLTCGHHRATKVGPSLYSSARAMVPVLRNRHVYFQVSCVREGPLAPSIGVGLSTPEMPLSTLVGAFSNSVGFCSTGQILMSSRWYGEPGEFAMRKAGMMTTVGVLVYLDGSRPFRSWDGDMLQQASATFAASAAAGPGEGGGGVHVQQDHGEEACLSPPPPPPDCPPVEEVAPWEVAAAGAAAATAATSSARLIKNGGGGGGGGGAGASSGAAAPALGIGRGGGTMLPPDVPETSAALGLALPKDRDLFPTVTIHSPNTEILCRFCAEDLLGVTRENMGAPPGAPVYALDGSLINLPH